MDDNKQWKILKVMGIPDHLTRLLIYLYAGKEATVRTRYGTTDWFTIGKGLCQGCILSPCLFNLYAKCVHAQSLQLCPTLCDPMDCSLPISSVHGDSAGKNTGVGCHALLQGIFPTQGSNPCLMSLALTSGFFMTGTLYAEYIMRNARLDDSSWNQDCWKKYQPQACKWYHFNVRKWRGTKEPLDEGKSGQLKNWFKTTFKKLRSWHPVPSLMENRWRKSGNSDSLFSWAPKSFQTVMKLKDVSSLEGKLWQT